MTWNYKVVVTESNFQPDVTEVNTLAAEGWELMDMQQIGGATHEGRFWYLLRRKADPQPVARHKFKGKA